MSTDPATPASSSSAWARALLTALLLLIALGWAVLAGVATQWWLRASLAGGSLLLLAIAGFISIPPLLRRSLQRWLNRRIEFHFTAAGLVFLLGLAILLLAAFTSGNNLIYMVAACLLGALLASGFASTLNLSGMVLRFQFPPRIFAGQETPIQLTLENEKGMLPAYSLTVLATSRRLRAARAGFKARRGLLRPGAAGEGTAREGVAPRRGLPRLLLRFRGSRAATGPNPPQNPADSGLLMRPAYFPFIPRRGRTQVTSTLQFPQRGYYSTTAFALSTRFPFALIDKRRRFQTSLREEAMLVYPMLAPQSRLHHHFPELAEEFERYEPGQGQELYRVRPHQPTDGTRRIHWKATARAGQLQVREFTRESSRRLRILVALAAPPLTAAEAEAAISLCAALVWNLASSDTWIEFEGRNAISPAPGAHGHEPHGAVHDGKHDGKHGTKPADTKPADTRPAEKHSARHGAPAPATAALHLPMAPAAEHLDAILEYLALIDLDAPLLPPAAWHDPDVEEFAFSDENPGAAPGRPSAPGRKSS